MVSKGLKKPFGIDEAKLFADWIALPSWKIKQSLSTYYFFNTQGSIRSQENKKQC